LGTTAATSRAAASMKEDSLAGRKGKGDGEQRRRRPRARPRSDAGDLDSAREEASQARDLPPRRLLCGVGADHAVDLAAPPPAPSRLALHTRLLPSPVAAPLPPNTAAASFTSAPAPRELLRRRR
jgi:hypothetical protein